MRDGLHSYKPEGIWRRTVLLATLALAVMSCSRLQGQTSTSGALTGVALDPTGAVLPATMVRLRNQDTGMVESVTADDDGRFHFLLLSPGWYEVQARSPGSNELIGKALIYFF